MVSNLLWQPTAIKLLPTDESPEERQDYAPSAARMATDIYFQQEN